MSITQRARVYKEKEVDDILELENFAQNYTNYLLNRKKGDRFVIKHSVFAKLMASFNVNFDMEII